MTARDGIRLAATARFLALAFGPPGEDELAEAAVIAAGLRELEPAPDPDLEELVSLLALAGLADSLAGEYEALFDLESPCPPYEGSYESDPFRQARQLADVAGFYRAFGALASRDRPDHACCELEFLAYLVAGRLAAEDAGDAERAAVCRQAEDSFLCDHLGRWLPEMCRRVERVTSSAFYARAAQLGERVVGSELAASGLEPAPLPRRRASAVEVDVVECG
jgi:TorA maturation chaperone TorD